MKFSKIVISGNEVKQDEHGRFRLNDLHRASGGKQKHRPSNFLKTPSGSGLVAEIIKCSPQNTLAPVETVNGRGGGTYVSKDVVYSYAMWISPEFQLNVIRKFDEAVQSEKRGRSIVDQAESACMSLTEEMNRIAGDMDRLKAAGSSWGKTGADLRKIRAEVKRQFLMTYEKAQLQLGID